MNIIALKIKLEYYNLCSEKREELCNWRKDGHGYLTQSRDAFFWDYSGYSCSSLGITEYTEFQFWKERSFWKRNTRGRGDLRTTMSAHARVAAQDFPPKISQKNTYSGYSEQTVFLSFCSFCHREQNERNDILIIPKTESLPKEHKYRLFQVFWNSPKRTHPMIQLYSCQDYWWPANPIEEVGGRGADGKNHPAIK